MGLTPGQPKILDYLLYRDGVLQREIAEACHIEPATLTSVLFGMEKHDLVIRKNLNGNRRNLYVYLTDKGKELAVQLETQFKDIEKDAFYGFSSKEREELVAFLTRINKNITKEE